MSDLDSERLLKKIKTEHEEKEEKEEKSPTDSDEQVDLFTRGESLEIPDRGASEEPDLELRPISNLVDALLTDLYQITMAYGYWSNGRQDEQAVFDLYFRKNPFHGEFTIFAGLGECIRYLKNFSFSKSDVDFLKRKFPEWQTGFWDWLAKVDASKIRVYAIPEGTLVFPSEPLLRIEGPLAIAQLLETTLLVLTNYASLVATNAARFRLAAGPNKGLLEFGLRRAQGPDGAVSASRYAYIGGFDGTSNVKASKLFGIHMSGTQAHSFVVSFVSIQDLKTRTITDAKGKSHDFVAVCLEIRNKLGRRTNEGELTAFIAYAQAYPNGFLALVDTYDTLETGIWNFIIVALGLHQLGFMPRGIRLDSGDLAYLSKECRKIFTQVSEQFNVPFDKLTIVASNDLNESVLWSLREQGHEVDSFGIGTHLVTCQSQPALGCVYKLVEINEKPRIKISQDIGKVTIPGRKEIFRLYNSRGEPVCDLMISSGSGAPLPQKRILCRHPFNVSKRVYVTPSKVEPLHVCVWDGKLTKPLPSLSAIKARVQDQIKIFRKDHLRQLNPTPYKVSVSGDLYTFMSELWQAESPISEIK